MGDRNRLKKKFLHDMDKVVKKAEPAREGQASEGPLSAAARDRMQVYENMVRNCAVAIFAIDTNHCVIHWNRACEELTGLKAEEVLGTANHWKAFYDHHRPCLSDLLVDNSLETMQDHYRVYGSSVLLPHGLHAEGWFHHVGGRERYLIFDASPVCGHGDKLVAALETLQDITELKRVEEERERLNVRLQDALDRIKTLTGLIPICAGCKKIRDDKGYWNQLEEYLEKHSGASFSHGLCPECFGRFFPDAKKSKA